MKLYGGKRPAKPPQFSKRMCLRAWRLMEWTVVVCVLSEALLQYTGRGSISAVVTIALSLISFVTMFVQGGYLLQNVARDTSLNKHGIHLPAGGDKHFIERENQTVKNDFGGV